MACRTPRRPVPGGSWICSYPFQLVPLDRNARDLGTDDTSLFTFRNTLERTITNESKVKPHSRATLRMELQILHAVGCRAPFRNNLKNLRVFFQKRAIDMQTAVSKGIKKGREYQQNLCGTGVANEYTRSCCTRGQYGLMRHTP